MSRIKLIFIQTIMISTAILFGIGVQSAVLYFKDGNSVLNWAWYIPLSYVLTGFACSLPTCILVWAEENKRIKTWVGILIHFLILGAIVSGCGYLFSWYENFTGFLLIIIMYVLIYLFVWNASFWLAKSEAKKINEAITGIRDEE